MIVNVNRFIVYHLNHYKFEVVAFQEQLFILCGIGAESHLFLVDRDTLTVEKRLKSFDGAAYSGVLCSDGEQLANVCKTEEVFFYSFVNHNTN